MEGSGVEIKGIGSRVVRKRLTTENTEGTECFLKWKDLELKLRGLGVVL